MPLLEANPQLFLDSLYCEEQPLDEKGENFDNVPTTETVGALPPFLLGQDLSWGESEVASLLSKESDGFPCYEELFDNECLANVRKEGVGWILSVHAHYGFCALTAALGVSYFDRFILSCTYQRDKRWLSQLAAVASLSLAAKLEEREVPLLLDLQVAESKYVFEAKTIQRMELLVLSTLGWRMHSVTPLSFFDHMVRRFGGGSTFNWRFLWKCENLLLSLIGDLRFVNYKPSVVAAAIMLYVNKEIEPFMCTAFRDQLISVLGINEDKLKDCCQLILELSPENTQSLDLGHKRKSSSIPSSPCGVIDVSFSFDSSNDSWAVASSVSSSPEPRIKRSRFQDQQMRLPSLGLPSMDMLRNLT